MLYIYNVQCVAVNAKWYIIMTARTRPLFKFQSAANHTRYLLMALKVNSKPTVKPHSIIPVTIDG